MSVSESASVSVSAGVSVGMSVSMRVSVSVSVNVTDRVIVRASESVRERPRPIANELDFGRQTCEKRSKSTAGFTNIHIYISTASNFIKLTKVLEERLFIIVTTKSDVKNLF